jgi:hypothetical protein
MASTGRIELARLDVQQIAARVVCQPVMAEELPQPVDIRVERLSGAPRWPLSPERIDEVIARVDLVALQYQHRQQRPLLSAPRGTASPLFDRESGPSVSNRIPAG